MRALIRLFLLLLPLAALGQPAPTVGVGKGQTVSGSIPVSHGTWAKDSSELPLPYGEWIVREIEDVKSTHTPQVSGRRVWLEQAESKKIRQLLNLSLYQSSGNSWNVGERCPHPITIPRGSQLSGACVSLNHREIRMSPERRRNEWAKEGLVLDRTSGYLVEGLIDRYRGLIVYFQYVVLTDEKDSNSHIELINKKRRGEELSLEQNRMFNYLRGYAQSLENHILQSQGSVDLNLLKQSPDVITSALSERRQSINRLPTQPGSIDAIQAEVARLAAEAEAARRRQKEVEEQLAKDRERVVAATAAAQPQPAFNRNERRVALIFGNSAYRSSPLVNPVNDASDLDATLRGLGFKTTLVKDASIAQMRNATRQFADEAASSDVALIFFAGHGIEAKGRNYLIPVSADIKHEYELEDQAYDAGRWLDMLESMKSTNKQRVNIVIIDACRNNDLSRGWRSASRGLARMDAPTGTFVAFATAPGKVAMDGAKGQRNSPFTKNLLRAIQTPDMPIELMFKEVRRLVLEETKNEQVPWDNSSLVGDFVFKRTR